MDKALLNRIPRKLREKPGRYIALALMVAISAYCLVSICGSAETLIAGSTDNAQRYSVEDGQFSCLDPLSDQELSQLTDLGVQVEPSFYMDFDQGEDSAVRVFAMRQNINLVAIDEGGTAPGDGEAVLMRNYADAKNLAVGDSITVGGQTLQIVGLCTSPDYENPLRNLTDPSASFDKFGTVFVTQATYDALHVATASTVSQSYLYAYKLYGSATNDDVVECVSSLKFDALTAQNDFVRNMAYDKTAEKRQIESEVTQLDEGTSKLQDAVTQLQSGLEQLESGAQTATAASSYASTGAGGLEDGAASLSSAAATIDQVTSSLGTFQEMIAAIDSFVDAVDEGVSNYSTILHALNGFAESFKPYIESDPNMASAYEAVLDAAQQLEANKGNMEKARDTALALRKILDEKTEGYSSFSDMAGEITSQMMELSDGLSTLSSGLGSLDGGIALLASNMSTAVSGNSQILDGITELNTRVADLEQQSQELTNRVFDTKVNKVSVITTQANNPRVGTLAKNQSLFRIIGIVLSVLLLLLISYVISVFVSHTIEEERSIIGAMYALGISRGQVLANYVLLPVALALVGGIVGTLIGLSPVGVSLQIDQVESAYSVVHVTALPPAWVLVGGLLLPPLIAALVNVAVIFRKLNLPVLDLLNRREGNVRTFDLSALDGLSFNRKFQVRRVMHERGIVLTMFLGTFAATLLIMLGIDCYSVCTNLIDDAQSETKWEYLYTYVYPEDAVPEGGTAVYLKNLDMSGNAGESHSIMLMGTNSQNPYFDVTPSVGKNKCTISNAVAKKFGLSVGDKIVMTDGVTNIDYAFTVDQVITYESGLYAFMDIGSMRELFNKDTSYYNTVLSAEPLNINAQALYSTTTYDDVQRAAQQFYDSIRPRMILLMVLPVVLFAVIMYLMLMVMIDRAALGISLLKIFGYEDPLVRKLYLRANTLLVIIFALIEIPVCKLIMDAVYAQVMVSSAVAGRFDTHPLAYVLAFVVILLIYTLVNKLLLRRVNKITPSDVLRNR